VELLDAEVTARNSDAFDTGSMGRRNVEGSVADREASFRVDWPAENERSPLERLLGAGSMIMSFCTASRSARLTENPRR
jgi:hypothetical protein